jgi:hypothetical protein
MLQIALATIYPIPSAAMRSVHPRVLGDGNLEVHQDLSRLRGEKLREELMTSAPSEYLILDFIDEDHRAQVQICQIQHARNIRESADRRQDHSRERERLE